MVEPAHGWATVAALAVAMSIASCSGKSERDGENDGGTGGDTSGGAGQLGGTGGDDQGGTGGIGGTAGTAGDGSAAVAGVGTGSGGDASGAGSNAGGSGSGGEPAGSGGLPAGSGGTGGTPVAGTGGTGGSPVAGTGGKGGTGGSSGAPATLLPSCMRELFDACPMEGACQFELTTTERRNCFASGAREEWEYPQCLGPQGSALGERRFYKSNGDLCFKVVLTLGAGCESPSETWTDGNGDPVATKSTPFSQQPTITCADGEISRCGGAVGPACQWADWPSPMCTQGSCPAAP